jgi:rubrerythrin
MEKIKSTIGNIVSPGPTTERPQEKNVFKPFEERRIPIEDQFMNWNTMIKAPYDKDRVDAYTRTRVILMNGIENNSVLTSHAMARMTENEEIKRAMALIRRADSQHQETVDWLNPGNQSILETTIGYEQVAVDLTANLAKNEPEDYFRQVLDFALLEDFDHLYRYSLLMKMLENKDAENIVQGKTEIKPGRPTSVEHRHPDDEHRMHFDKNSVHVKSWMNYFTIVSGEQQTMLYYRTHGANLEDDLARKLYAEIAEIEEQHVSQYESVGDPTATPLQMATLIQLNEAYNYYSCAQTEPNERIRSIWSEFCAHEIEHFNMCNDLMVKYEKMDIRDLIKDDSIEPLIVFEPNKEYVNKVLEEQVHLRPYNMKFVPEESLPSDWKSFGYQSKVNAGGVPSEIVEERWKVR